MIERPGKPLLLIEINSSQDVEERHLHTLKMINQDLKNSEAVCFSRDKYAKKIGKIMVYPWSEGIVKYFK